MNMQTSVRKLFFVHLWKVLVLCVFFEFELSQNYRDVTAIIKPQRFDFLIECKLNEGTCQFHFSHNENIQFLT